jgi:hypothetical protein
MKREIKFRAIQAGADAFIYGFPYAVYPENYIDSIINKHGIEYIRTDTIGQFTGLISPAGAEIYEGDIIAFNKSEKIKLNVVFENGCFFLYHYEGLKEPDGKPYRWGALYRLFDADIRGGLNFEVIGNIYQNKD